MRGAHVTRPDLSCSKAGLSRKGDFFQRTLNFYTCTMQESICVGTTTITLLAIRCYYVYKKSSSLETAIFLVTHLLPTRAKILKYRTLELSMTLTKFKILYRLFFFWCVPRYLQSLIYDSATSSVKLYDKHEYSHQSCIYVDECSRNERQEENVWNVKW